MNSEVSRAPFPDALRVPQHSVCTYPAFCILFFFHCGLFIKNVLKHIFIYDKFTYFKCTLQWFWVTLLSGAAIIISQSQHGHHPQPDPSAHLLWTPVPPLPPETANLLSVPINLPFLDASCKWNPISCGLLVWLLSLSLFLCSRCVTFLSQIGKS